MVLNINYVQSSILEIASDLGFFLPMAVKQRY